MRLTTSFASPITPAVRASIVSPPVTSSTAFARPIIRGVRAVPPQPGNRPSFTSGKPNAVLLAVGKNSPIAPHGELGAAADANAIDRRDRDVMRLREPAEELLPAAAEAGDLLLRCIEPGDELLQIGPGNEHARLGGANHEAGEIFAIVQLVEMVLERSSTWRDRMFALVCASPIVITAMSGSGYDSESVVGAAMRVNIPQNCERRQP